MIIEPSVFEKWCDDVEDAIVNYKLAIKVGMSDTANQILKKISLLKKEFPTHFEENYSMEFLDEN